MLEAQAVGHAGRHAKLTVLPFPRQLKTLLERVSQAMATGERLAMLLLLDHDTFALNHQGDTMAAHVRVALAAHVPMMLAYDSSSCDFDTCIEMTPDDLVTGGLYQKHVAIPLGEHPLERAASSTIMLRHLQKRAVSPAGSPRRLAGFRASIFELEPITVLFGARRRSSINPIREHAARDSSALGPSTDLVGREESCRTREVRATRAANDLQHIVGLESMAEASYHSHVLRLAKRRRLRRSPSSLSLQGNRVCSQRSSTNFEFLCKNSTVPKRNSIRRASEEAFNKVMDASSATETGVAEHHGTQTAVLRPLEV